jgi:Fe-S-cluster-containing dehydrogenase component/formate-dependent nitrite reductase membrane component NrfD
LVPVHAPPHGDAPTTDARLSDAPKWAKIIDNTRCIGCHACTVACKSENEVPLSVTRTYVKYVDHGEFPNSRRAFQVTRCNMCDDAPCVTVCPTSAMFRRPDGIVDFDKSACIGCKACIAACPYDAIFINPEDHSAEKCNFCAHRLDMELEPACVVVCPTEAIIVGDMNDPASRIAQMLGTSALSVRRPEKETHPKLFYKGASQVTLDPLAARRPDGGLFMWSEQGGGPGRVTSGHPGPWNSSAAAQLSYDVPQHTMPWDWRVSLYTWTKSVSAGAYLVAALLALTGVLAWTDPLWMLLAPLVAMVFLAITGALLLLDLEHPERWYFLFTRPQWRSWLVRGAVVISAYGLLLAGHLLAGFLGAPDTARALIWGGIPIAAATSMYTAWLFAQAKARDLWQSPLLPPHLLVHAALAGAAALLLVRPSSIDAETALRAVLATSCVVHLLLVAGEVSMTHVTAHAKLANWEMVRGRYRGFFLAGLVLVGFGCAAPWLGVPSAVLAVAGLLAHEHAYVQAGQAVPLA